MATNGNERQRARRWGRDREAAAVLLAAGRSYRDVAETLRLGVQTVNRWMQEPGYRDYVRSLRRELNAQLAGRVAAQASKAFDTLDGLLDSEAEMVRLEAVKTVFKIHERLRADDEFAEELAGLRRDIETLRAGHADAGGTAAPIDATAADDSEPEAAEGECPGAGPGAAATEPDGGHGGGAAATGPVAGGGAGGDWERCVNAMFTNDAAAG